MAKYKTIRVYPDGQLWVVKKDSASKASALRDTKDDALRIAREIAINQGLTIIIHGKDGRIQRSVTPEESSSNDNCFITTACVNYYGLDDKCYQLQTLRKFRDTYLKRSSGDRALIKKYYEVAPTIVELIKLDSNRKILFEEIFRKINSACFAIENNKLNQAKIIYIEAVSRLIQYFKIN